MFYKVLLNFWKDSEPEMSTIASSKTAIAAVARIYAKGIVDLLAFVFQIFRCERSYAFSSQLTCSREQRGFYSEMPSHYPKPSLGVHWCLRLRSQLWNGRECFNASSPLSKRAGSSPSSAVRLGITTARPEAGPGGRRQSEAGPAVPESGKDAGPRRRSR